MIWFLIVFVVLVMLARYLYISRRWKEARERMARIRWDMRKLKWELSEANAEAEEAI